MVHTRRAGRIKVRAVVILILVLGLLGAGAFGGHRLRKRVMARNALAAGLAAFDQREWETAITELRGFLRQYPKDVSNLEKYAVANLRVHPRASSHMASAIDAYRRILRRQPGDDAVTDKVCRLYLLVGDYDEAIYVARQRLEIEAHDASATVTLGQALCQRKEYDEARTRLSELVEEHHRDAVSAYWWLAKIARDSVPDNLTREERDRVLPEAQKEALSWLDRGVQRNPSSAEALARRALFHTGLVPANVEAARADLRAADALSPQDPQVLLLIGQAWVDIPDREGGRAVVSLLDQMPLEALERFDVDREEFALRRFREVVGPYMKLFGTPAEVAAAADRALAELSEGYRANILPIVVDLFLRANRLDEAEKYRDEYREWVVRAGRAAPVAEEILALLSAHLAYRKNRPFEVIGLLEPVVAANPRSVQGWFLLSQAYLQTDQSRRAVHVLEQYLIRKPDDLLATTQLVREFVKHRDWRKAEQYAQALRPIEGSNIEARLLRIEAQVRMAIQKSSSSSPSLGPFVAELETVRTAHPLVTPTYVLLAAIAEYENRHDSAIEILQSAIGRCVEPLEARMQLARLLVRLQRNDEALEVMSLATRAHPTASRSWIGLSALLAGVGRLEAARDTLEEAVKITPGTPEGREIATALAQLNLEHFDRTVGLDLLKRLAAENPYEVGPRVMLLELPETAEEAAYSDQLIKELKDIEGERSGVLWRMHRSRLLLLGADWKPREQEIIDLLTKCIETDPAWARPVLILGRLYEHTAQKDKAEQLYRRALEQIPDALDIVDRLMSVLESQKRFAESQALLSSLDERLQKASALSMHRIGQALGTKEYDSAIKELEMRVAADPKDSNARIILARLVHDQFKDTTRALKLLDDAQALDPESMTVPAVRSLIFFLDGQLDKALAVLDGEVTKRHDFRAHLLRAEFNVSRGALEAAERDYVFLTTLAGSEAGGFEVLGKFYFRTDRRAEAIQAWERAVQLDPELTSARRILMKTLLAGKEESEQQRGGSMLDAMLAETPADAELLQVRAAYLLQRGTPQDRAEAEKVLEQVVGVDPRAVTAYITLIQTSYNRGELTRAADLVTEALKANSSNPDLLLAAAQVEVARRNVSRAKELALAAIEKDPKRVTGYVFLAELAADSHDYEEAVGQITQAIQLAPEDLVVQLQRAQWWDRLGKRDDAIAALEAFRKVTDASGPNVLLLVSLAEFYCDAGKEELVEERLRQASEAAPDDPRVVLARWRCLADQHRYNELSGLISEYRASHADQTETLTRGGRLLAESGRAEWIQEAKSIFEAVLQADAQALNARLALAQVSYAAGDRAGARKAYEGVLELVPNHQQALNDLAWILAEQNEDLPAAIKLADRGVNAYGDDPHLLDTRGVILTKLDRFDEARKDLSRAVALAAAKRRLGTQARALIHLADVFTKMHDSAGARQSLNEAKALDSQYDLLSTAERDKLNTTSRGR